MKVGVRVKVRVRVLVLAPLVLMALAFPVAPATASSSGLCIVHGASARTGVDISGLENREPWHLNASDGLSVTVTAPFDFRTPEAFEQGAGGVTTFYWLASLGIMERHATDPWGSGTIHDLGLAGYAVLGPRFGMGAAAYGTAEADSCSWFVDVVLDDVNPWLTVFGGGALAVGVLGIAGVALAARRGRGWPARLIAAVLGATAGTALFAAAGQFGIIPYDGGGYLALLVGLLAGLLLAGRFRSRNRGATPNG